MWYTYALAGSLIHAFSFTLRSWVPEADPSGAGPVAVLEVDDNLYISIYHEVLYMQMAS